MKPNNKQKLTRKQIKLLALATAASLTGLGLGVLTEVISEKIKSKQSQLPKNPTKQINEKYYAELINLPRLYTVAIRDTSGNTYLVGNDVNKDTTIDNIYKDFDITDPTLLNLTSSEELSKIEKELLEK